LALFLAKKVPKTNVEKSIRGTQNPGTFRRRTQSALRARTLRIPLPGTRGHSVILTSPTDDRLLTPPTNFFSRPEF